MPIPITDEQFEKVPNGQIFAMGMTTDDPDGLYMTGSGNILKWVAKKGWANDWAIYCHWAHHSWEFILEQGDKVHGRDNIKRVLDISDNLLGRYRP